MLKNTSLIGRQIIPMNICIEPQLAKMREILLELEEIKKIFKIIEEKDLKLVKIDELNAIEKRLNSLEYKLFYDSLN